MSKKIEACECEPHELTAINSRCHSLFKNEAMRVYLFDLFIGPFDDDDVALHRIVDQLHTADAHDHLNIRINSPGGRFDQAIQVIGAVQECFGEDTSTFIEQNACSAGAMIFLACGRHERIIGPYSQLMLHQASMCSYGKLQESEACHNSFNQVWNDFCQDHLSGVMSREELDAMNNGKDFWFNAEEMCRRGMATHVMVDGKKYSAQAFVNFREKQRREKAKTERATKKLAREAEKAKKANEPKTDKKSAKKPAPKKRKSADKGCTGDCGCETK